MAKYVYHVPEEGRGCGQDANRAATWGELTYSFGQELQGFLEKNYGIHTCVFRKEDGVDLDEGSSTMGKDWFGFEFTVFAEAAIYLDMINVPLEWRHQGVGEWLVNRLKRFAGEHGLRYIFLGSYEPSNSFWEKEGFVEITDYPDFIVGVDTMAK